MTNKTHTDERKMVQLSYLVPALLCYIRLVLYLVSIYIYQLVVIKDYESAFDAVSMFIQIP